MNVRPHYLDVTSVIDREEVADAHGALAAWDATIKTITLREARETDPIKKKMLRLSLYNAQVQRELVTMKEQGMSKQDLIAAVRNHAMDNYNIEGWDYLVECWEDSDVIDAMGKATTTKQAINNVRDALRPLADMRDEVRAAGEW